MVWQCSTKSHEDLFQGNFANNSTIQLEGFVTVHVENLLG